MNRNNRYCRQTEAGFAAEKPLEQIFDILYRAQFESTLARVALIREQFHLMFAQVQQGDPSFRNVKALSLELQQEITRLIWNLEIRDLQMRSRN